MPPELESRLLCPDPRGGGGPEEIHGYCGLCPRCYSNEGGFGTDLFFCFPGPGPPFPAFESKFPVFSLPGDEADAPPKHLPPLIHFLFTDTKS